MGFVVNWRFCGWQNRSDDSCWLVETTAFDVSRWRPPEMMTSIITSIDKWMPAFICASYPMFDETHTHTTSAIEEYSLKFVHQSADKTVGNCIHIEARLTKQKQNTAIIYSLLMASLVDLHDDTSLTLSLSVMTTDRCDVMVCASVVVR